MFGYLVRFRDFTVFSVYAVKYAVLLIEDGNTVSFSSFYAVVSSRLSHMVR